MSLPNYLAKIKSSGVYRYVFDKSQVPTQEAGTLRLVIGYSEKGPFNTPLYVENKKDFISNFGNINKRLEKKGIFFHRMALQALNAGPILALNIKPFGKSGDQEMPSVTTAKIIPWNTLKDADDAIMPITGSAQVKDIYDTNRFWKLDADLLPEKLGADDEAGDASTPNFSYIKITTTDTIDNSCSFFIRPYLPSSYDISLRDWYATQPDMEAPSYLLGTYETEDGESKCYLDLNLKNFFAEVYVFKGEFTAPLCNAEGTLGKYFNVSEDGKDIELKPYIENAFKKRVDTLPALADDPNSNFVGVYQGCLLPEFTDANGNYISLDILFNSDYVNHKMLMKLDDRWVDEMIETMKFYDLSAIYNEDWQNTIDVAADGSENTLGGDLQKFSYSYAYHPTYMRGYEYGILNQTMSAEDWQKEIFTVLNSDESEGMQEALTNNVDCEYHYIVDTFDSFIEKDCKSVLTAIARKKDNAFAILNFPAMKKFMDYKVGTQYPYHNNITKRFDINKIADKNLQLSYFCLPKDADGASWAAYYTPVVLTDGTIKTTIPSAALVSNLFMEKWSSRQPYYIVAGPNHGRLSENGLVGPDYNYSRADLDVLEPFGANVIIYVPRKGVFINSNQTAKQVPVSALSKVHVRELVIYLQNEIEKMLQNYQWELNTSTLRDTIKTKADTILETIAANGGVYAYLNVCDESNNTPEVIDNEMIILDTSIEPARGAGKMVQRLTIHRTGGISSLK